RAVDREGRPVSGIRVNTDDGKVLDGDQWTGDDGVARLSVNWDKTERVEAFALIGTRRFASPKASPTEAASGLEVVVDRGVTVLARVLGGEADTERVLVWPAAAGAVQIGEMGDMLLGGGGGSFRRFSGSEVAAVGFVPGTRIKFALFEDGFRRAVAEVLIPDAPYCEVLLDAGGGFTEVSARLLDEAGHARREERVWARIGPAGADVLKGADVVVSTDAEGGLHMRLPTGKIQFASVKEGLGVGPALELTAESIALGDVVVPGLSLLASGTVRDVLGAPANLVWVNAWPVGVERDDGRPWSTETGADGTFEIRGWNHGGLLDLMVTTGELRALSEGLPIGTTGIELIARPTGTLVGNLVALHEDMHSDVFVKVVPSTPTHFERAERIGRAASLIVEESGAFEFPELYPGLYDVVVEVLGTCARRIEGIRIPEEGGVVADPRLQGLSIAGDYREVVVRVVGPEGPLDATVALGDEAREDSRWERSTWANRLLSRTDESGEARFFIPPSARLPVHVRWNDAMRSIKDPVFPLEVVWVPGASVDIGVDLGADLRPLLGFGGLEVALLNLEVAGLDSAAIGEHTTLPVYGTPTASISPDECQGQISVKFEDIPREVRLGVLIAPVGVIDLPNDCHAESRGAWHWVGEFRLPKDAVTHSVRFPVSADLISRMIKR
ncbi:MAG TPA: hypothetical protein PKA37_06640, partial [Planctomycetota bacterium]|nr:hypothetical protein [Planctomycetota bacterium]